MSGIKVTYSLPSAESLAEFVEANWDVKVNEVTRLHQGFNDSYKVSTESDTYLAKVYRTGWRTDSQVLSELKIIEALCKKKIPAFECIRTSEDSLFASAQLPEGERPVVLFEYSDGNIPFPLTAKKCEEHGKLLGKFHKATSKMKGGLDRLDIDKKYLINEPIRILLENFPEYEKKINVFEKQLKIRFARINFKSGAQLIHGNYLNSNLLEAGKKTVLFDMDFCGFGLPEYDLATYCWSLQAQLPKKDAEKFFKSFIKGYEKQIPEIDASVIKLLMIVKELWEWTSSVENSSDLRSLSGHSFEERIKVVQDMIEDL
jgi:Ser/Thr protein kinase RdoA (MazF antagonist)